jgi:O-antigen biosynthesis protein
MSLELVSVDTRALIRVPEPHPRRQPPAGRRVSAGAKFFRLGSEKWFVKGLTYGPFAPNSLNQHLPERSQLLADFRRVAELGANCIRLYHIPRPQVLDDALEHGLRVFIDVPWEKHRCFFEDWYAQEDARQRVRKTARLLGSHPGIFAISVANEIPKDIVRYYGAAKIARFVDDLIDIVKQEAPDCPVTYTNYPSTEFLELRRPDFLCHNVYLHDPGKLSAYLDRLQHLAGNKPLILGEFGVDTIRQGEPEQARQLANHLRKVFRHGLAGSFVFSYTDEWFTGGHQIEDWAFGITTRDRRPKQSASELSHLWRKAPWIDDAKLPKASVVVCSYNGAATLDECLGSLVKLDYPDYEVILVDDGSTDHTRSILKKYPTVRCIHQSNQGLSVARNVGAQAAVGEVVVYTDSDCVADTDWLRYLLTALVDNNLDAVGGPNVPPPSDCWTAHCVAHSPGGPSHVMSDDRTAEHIPGCNMAFRRDKLLATGGFDPQFRVAGDDVDFCWRFMDKGFRIGYSPSALVWHHRRNSIRAYFQQQAGYGRAEAMLHAKHPHRFNVLGAARWKGVIYGEGAVGLPAAEPAICHGSFGMGLFQIMYRRNDYSLWGYLTLLEWHLLALFLLAMSWFIPLLAIVPALMWCMSLAAAVRSVRSVCLPASSSLFTRLVVLGLHLAQPVVRAKHRYAWRLKCRNLPRIPADNRFTPAHVKSVSRRRHDLYWESHENRGREELLAALQIETAKDAVETNYQNEWSTWDAAIRGDLWNDVLIHTATEELGWPHRFTRARCQTHATALAKILAGAWAVVIATALLTCHWQLAACGAGALLLVAISVMRSQTRCLNMTERLLWRAGHHAKLDNVVMGAVPQPFAATLARPVAAKA